MRFPAVKAVFLKEFRTLIRDKKTLFVMFGLPLILYPLMIIGISSFLISMDNDKETAEYYIEVFGNDPAVCEYLNSDLTDVDCTFILCSGGSVEEAESKKDFLIQQIEDGEFDAYLLCEDNGYSVVSNSSIPNSDNAGLYLADALYVYQSIKTENIIEENGLNASAVLEPFTIEEFDTASDEQTMGSLIGGIIPLLIILGVFLGTMMPATDVTAGERERSTQETLMTFPVTGKELVTGKFLLVSLCGIVSAILYLITVTILGVYIMAMSSSAGGAAFEINFATFLPSVGVTLLAVIAFALFLGAVIMFVCSLAKSTKEASTYTSPMIFVIMMFAYAGMLDVRLTRALSVVPILNVVLLIKSVFVFEYDIIAILTVLISNMAYAAIAIVALGKIYTSERILFGEGGGSLLERPSFRVKGALPTLGDGIITLLISLVLYIYIGGAFQINMGLWGIGLTQLLIIAVPMFTAWFGRVDYSAVFSLQKPKLSAVPASVVVGVGAFLLCNILTMWIVPSSSDSVSTYSENFVSLLDDMGLLGELLIVCIAPAICEEGLFRGYLTGALKNKLKPVWIILITSVIFGLYHMNLFQGVYACMLGIVLGWVVYRTGSIFCACVIHLTANSLSVIFNELPDSVFESSLLGTIMSNNFVAAGFGFLLLALGIIWIFGITRKKNPIPVDAANGDNTIHDYN